MTQSNLQAPTIVEAVAEEQRRVGRRYRRGEVDKLLECILAKLDANREVLSRSLEFGRLTWHMDRSGRIEVKIQPEL